MPLSALRRAVGTANLKAASTACMRADTGTFAVQVLKLVGDTREGPTGGDGGAFSGFGASFSA